MKTATNRFFGWFLLSFVCACEFGEPSIDSSYLDSPGGRNGYNPNDGSVTLESCPSACDTVTLLSVNKRKLKPSMKVLDLSNGNSCICPNGAGGSSSTVDVPVIAGSPSELPASGGSGPTQDPPASGAPGVTTDPPPASGGSGQTTDPAPASGGSGETFDPPASGGSGVTTDPPPASGGSGVTTDPPPAYGGSGETRDPPGSGGVASGGASSLGKGGGSTQDPPAGGKSASGGSLGAGGSTQGLALGGSPASGGSTPVGQGGGSTEDPPPAGGTSSLGAGGSNASGGTMSVGIGGGSTQDPPAGGTSASGGSLGAGGTSATGGSSPTGGTAGTGGDPPCGQEFKWYITSPKTLNAPATHCWNPTTGATVNVACQNGIYCYFRLQDFVPEQEWRCYVTTGNATTPRLPVRNSNEACVNAWGVEPYITTAEHYQVYSDDWSIVDDPNEGCVYSLVVNPECYYGAGVCLQ